MVFRQDMDARAEERQNIRDFSRYKAAEYRCMRRWGSSAPSSNVRANTRVEAPHADDPNRTILSVDRSLRKTLHLGAGDASGQAGHSVG